MVLLVVVSGLVCREADCLSAAVADLGRIARALLRAVVAVVVRLADLVEADFATFVTRLVVVRAPVVLCVARVVLRGAVFLPAFFAAFFAVFLLAVLDAIVLRTIQKKQYLSTLFVRVGAHRRRWRCCRKDRLPSILRG